MDIKKKSLYDLSWKVTEEIYRADSALSYSTLARYEREGFNNLHKLFDKLVTPSLVFGSAVDSIITGGIEEFESRFLVAEFPKISDTLITIAKILFNEYHTKCINIEDIPEDIIAQVGKDCDFYAGDKWKASRVKKIKTECKEYYSLLHLTPDKTVISTQMYKDINNTVNVLKDSYTTKSYFEKDSPFIPEIERLYQLKFKGTFEGINYRCMMDLVLVNHKEKLIIPVDLKTSSKTEWDFYKSFADWRYDIQARLYWAILKQNLEKDEYFKDFTLLDYRFIVANKRTLTPLIWNCPFTQKEGTLVFGKKDQYVFRSPFEIGKELSYYLKNKPKVPIGIHINKVNDIETWLNNG